LTFDTFPYQIGNVEKFVEKLQDLLPDISTFVMDATVATNVDIINLMNTLVNTNHNLKHLELAAHCDLKLLEKLKKLERLQIHLSPLDTDARLISKFQNLKSLHVRVESRISQLGNGFESKVNLLLDGILELTSLDTLILEGFVGGVRYFSKGLNNSKVLSLKRLAFRFLIDVNLADILNICESLKRLVYLEIDDSHDLLNEIHDIINYVSPKFTHILFTTLPLVSVSSSQSDAQEFSDIIWSGMVDHKLH